LERLNGLPGRLKVIGPGNHDRDSLGALELGPLAQLSSLLYLRPHRPLRIHWDHPKRTAIVASTMGYLAPEDPFFTKRDLADPSFQAERRTFQAELGRLRASLQAANEERRPGEPLILLFHYVPWSGSVWSVVIERAGVDVCVYGHIHWPDEWEQAPVGRVGQFGPTNYQLVAGDFLGWRPLDIGVLLEG